MQIPIKVRDTVSGVISFRTPPIEVSDYPLLVLALIAHQISGTGPEIEVGVQTSDDLETWDPIGGTLMRTAAGATRGAYTAASHAYGRYVRFSIAVTGTSPIVNYSIYVNLFPSS